MALRESKTPSTSSTPADLQAQFQSILQEFERDPERLAAVHAVDEIRQAEADHKRRMLECYERSRRARLKLVAPSSLDIVDRLEREIPQLQEAQRTAAARERSRLTDRIMANSRALHDEQRRLDAAGQPTSRELLAATPADREEWRAATAAFDEIRRPVFPPFEERLSDALKAKRAAVQRALQRVTPRLLRIYAKMVHLQAAAGRPLKDLSSRVHSMAGQINRAHERQANLPLVEDLSFPFFRQNPAAAVEGRTLFDTWLEHYAQQLSDVEGDGA